jgi:hypothetical protein
MGRPTVWTEVRQGGTRGGQGGQPACGQPDRTGLRTERVEPARHVKTGLRESTSASERAAASGGCVKKGIAVNLRLAWT